MEFKIEYQNASEVMRMLEMYEELMKYNLKVALIRTVLEGAKKIVEDCPVDTGRLRSSILGYLRNAHGIDVGGSDLFATQDGTTQSLTKILEYSAHIGTNVNYAQAVEYRHPTKSGFFRNNIPIIDSYFQEQMQEAVTATKNGIKLVVTY